MSAPADIIIVIGKGYDAYRGYHMEELHQAGKSIWLVDDEELLDRASLIVKEFRKADFDRSALRQAEQFAASASLPEAAIGLCYIESLLPWAAEFFAYLKVPFLTVEQARVARSKHEIRRAFETAGLPTPGYVLGTPERLLEMDHAYPVIVKPEQGYSSIGVERIPDRIGLASYFARDNNVHAESYVVEGVIDGTEYSIEGYANDGKVITSGLTIKFKTPLPYFEEIGHYCARSIQPGTAHRDVFERAVRALGIESSPFHFEFIDARGVLTPVEIGARLAGDKIPYLHRRVSGRSVLLEYLGVGREFPVVDSDGLGIVFFVPSEKGVVSDGFPSRKLDAALGEHYYECYPGKLAQTAPDDFFVRLGFCLIEANSVEEFAFRANEKIALFEQESEVRIHRIRANHV